MVLHWEGTDYDSEVRSLIATAITFMWCVSVPRIEPRRDPNTLRTMYVYIVDIERNDLPPDDPERHWTVDRRYHEFYVLESKLLEFHGPDIPKEIALPAKKSFGTKTRAFIESMRPIFNSYLHQLSNIAILRGSELLFLFLSSSTDEFTASFLPDNLNPIRAIRAVPSKLTRERGQNMNEFLGSLIRSADGSLTVPVKSSATASMTLKPPSSLGGMTKTISKDSIETRSLVSVGSGTGLSLAGSGSASITLGVGYRPTTATSHLQPAQPLVKDLLYTSLFRDNAGYRQQQQQQFMVPAAVSHGSPVTLITPSVSGSNFSDIIPGGGGAKSKSGASESSHVAGIARSVSNVVLDQNAMLWHPSKKTSGPSEADDRATKSGSRHGSPKGVAAATGDRRTGSGSPTRYRSEPFVGEPFDLVLYLLWLVYRIPMWLFRTLTAGRILFKATFAALVEWYTRRELSSASLLHEQRVRELIHLLRDAVFVDINADDDDESKRTCGEKPALIQKDCCTTSEATASTTAATDQSPEARRARQTKARSDLVAYLNHRCFPPPLHWLLRSLGDDKIDAGSRLIFDCLQRPVLNKQLAYCLLDRTLLEVFPDLKLVDKGTVPPGGLRV